MIRSLGRIPGRVALTAAFVAVPLSGCIPERSYEMIIDLRDEEKAALSQTVAEIATRMGCRFEPGDDAWHDQGHPWRACNPANLPMTKVVFDLQRAGSRIRVGVHEYVPSGPIRPEVEAYAAEVHKVVAELFGAERITMKKTGWKPRP
ncbi:MAG TPA: hypothetical protein VFZ95_07220 [Steroidobacteraceae bacterium]